MMFIVCVDGTVRIELCVLKKILLFGLATQLHSRIPFIFLPSCPEKMCKALMKQNGWTPTPNPCSQHHTTRHLSIFADYMIAQRYASLRNVNDQQPFL